jgi:prepilin-type N-terminal cleavage/methylation domain-containing protein
LHKQYGFSLVEVAIVLVIIGLALGSVLKGQELINSARVRNLAVQLDGVKLAYLGFQDRFHAFPGDLPTAAANTLLPGSPGGCTGGTACGNGRIEPDEIFVVWAHLSKSGFIIGAFNGLVTDTAPSAANNPVNPYGGFLQLINDSIYDDAAEPVQQTMLNVKTGGRVPPGVLGEMDLKIDDGWPLTGSFRSAGNVARTTTFAGGIVVLPCDLAGTPVQWYGASQVNNCAGVALQ